MIKPQPDPNQPFSSWAFTTLGLVRKTIGVLALVAPLISIRNLEPGLWFRYSRQGWGDFFQVHAYDRAHLAFIQAGVCFLLAVMVPKPSIQSLKERGELSKDKEAIAKKACVRIQLFVMASYMAWSVYYLVTGLTLPELPKVPYGDLLNRAFSVNVNIIPSLLLYWLFLELAKITVVGPARIGAQKDESAKEEEILRDNRSAIFHRAISLGVVALIIIPAWYAFAQKDDMLMQLAEVASACLNGVSLALVVGRLGNRVVDPGSITLGLLYFYAVIQTTAAIFYARPGVHLFATTIALPLKVLLWLVIVWAFTTGILSEYVHEIRDVLITKTKAKRATNN